MATPAQQRLPRYGHHAHRAPDWAGSRHVYRPRRPTTTPLYPVVQHHLETFLARRVLRYFNTHGLLDEADAHGMLSWRGSGGFSIDASVRIEGEDRAGVSTRGPSR